MRNSPSPASPALRAPGLLLLLLVPGPLAAQPPAPELGEFVFGPGADPCSSFVSAAEVERPGRRRGTATAELGRTPRYAAYAGWMQGFLSGLNSFNGSLGREGNTRARLAALERRCREQPEQPVMAALLQVLDAETAGAQSVPRRRREGVAGR